MHAELASNIPGGWIEGRIGVGRTMPIIGLVVPADHTIILIDPHERGQAIEEEGATDEEAI